jgi:mannosyltransferase OCH1-like enzyme
MIPKKIHYCWFGGNPLPKSALKCISTWRSFFPDYEIIEWNESAFDVNMMPYTQEAYKAGKYAFVSDVARFWILYNEGGIYFDTDVEVVKSFEDIVSKGAFLGVEIPSINGSYPAINPGLGLGAEAGNVVVKQILDYYTTLRFLSKTGEMNPGTVVTHTTKVLVSYFRLQPCNEIQKLGPVTIFPVDYFNPFDDITGVLKKTNNTRSIHWFSKSWIDKPSWYFKITRIIHRLFGTRFLFSIKSLFDSGNRR